MDLAQIELKLGAKGFFTVIFSNMEDKTYIFDNVPYFFNNQGLFMRHLEEFDNQEQEKFIATPI